MTSSMQKPRTIILFDMMRNRSHLFFRYLSTHPEIEALWHPFLVAFLFGPERILSKTTNSQGKHTDEDGKWNIALSKETYADAQAKLQTEIDGAAERGKIFVANEHCQMLTKQDITLGIVRGQPVSLGTNPTVIPDPIFKSIVPVFVIRNPLFSMPSTYKLLLATTEMRPGGEDWRICTGVSVQHRLFNFFLERDGKPPVVVDGDEVVWRTDELGQKLCKALGLEAGGLSDTWEAKSDGVHTQDALIAAALHDINASTGIQRGSSRPSSPNLEAEYAKWVEAFGEEAADGIREVAVLNAPLYEYMRGFAI